jgi:hypothetical protein
MSSHIGIEISRTACRIVELERSGGDESDTIVRSYAHSPAADALSLAPYRRRHAAVVVWGLHGEHRQALVSRGSYQHMRRDAVAAMKHAGVDARQMLADIAPAGAAGKGVKRRPVVVAMARTSDVAAVLRALTSAGVKVRSIVTPALALMSLARTRRHITAAGAIEAYVAFEETGTAIALVRDASLVAARELDWGYQSVRGVRSREDAANGLIDALTAFFSDSGVRPSEVSQICICGGLPELRNMTLPLMEHFDVEVEPLDLLFGVDANRLPEPADDFRERVADLRLAWAVAADWHAPIDFLRERRRRMTKTVLTRAAVVAGVATGVAAAWRLQQSSLFQPSPSTPQERTASTSPRPASPPSAQRVTPPPVPVPIPTPVEAPPPIRPAQGGPERRRGTPAVQPAIEEPSRTASLVLTPVPPPPVPPTVQPEPLAQAPSKPAARTPVTPPRPRPASDTPLPFDASLGTILYGADRKLAIVDGRIVQVGDDIRGARVVDITPDAVLFRDVQGRLRKLTLQDSRR